MQAYFHSRVGRLCHSGAVKGERHVSSKNNRRLTKVSFLSTLPTSRRGLVPRRIFLRKMRLRCTAWSHLPVRSVLDAPHRGAAPLLPEKGLARLAYSLASALVYGSLSLTTFFGHGQGHRFLYFCRAEALTGELRFCAAKWEFFELPSNFSGESPERSASNLPSPAKSLVCSGCSLASAVATPPLHYQLFSGKGGAFSGSGPAGRALAGVAVLVRPGEGFE